MTTYYYDVEDRDINYLEHIPRHKIDDKFVFYTLLEGNQYYPLFGCDKNRSYLYHILYNTHFENYSNITFINADFNLHENYKLIKEKLGIQEQYDINLKILPFSPMLNGYTNYLTFDVTEYSDHINYTKQQINKKYNFIFLTYSERYYKIYLLSKLSKVKNFIYSYTPDLDYNLDIDENFNIELLGDYIYVPQIDKKFLPCDPLPKGHYYCDKNFDSRIKKTLTDIDFFTGVTSRYLPPLEYHQSYFDLVGEAYTIYSNLFTDKMIKPLFFGKPFIVIGEVNKHKKLKELGFELYDEIFDYSFDSCDFQKRITSIIEQVKYISNLPEKCIKELDQKVTDKKIYNHQTFTKIMKHQLHYISSNILLDSDKNMEFNVISDYVKKILSVFSKIK